MTDTFIVNGRFLAMATVCQSVEETRYYLRGVAIQPNPHGAGAVLIATDGHRLAAFHDAAGVAPRDAIFTVSKEVVAAIKKLVRAEGDLATVEIGAGKITVGDSVLPCPEIDGSFPDWRRVIPRARPKDAGKPPPASIAFSSEYAGSFDFKGWCGKAKAIKMHLGVDAGAPVVIRRPDVPEFLGVLMPMRVAGKGDDSALPDWLDAA